MDQIRVMVRRQLSAAWRYRWVMVACAWLICGAGWVGSSFIPNQYEATARLYVDADVVLTPLLRGLAADTQVAAQVDLLQRTLLSRPNLEKLISNTDLDLGITGPADLERLVQSLSTSIVITPQTHNLFTIGYRNPNPKLAFDVVQTILTTFIENKTGNNRSEMQNAQLFIEQQIAAYERQLRDAEKRRADFRVKYMDLLPNETSGMSRLETAQQAARTLQGRLQDEMMKRDMLKGELAAVPPLLVTESEIANANGGSVLLAPGGVHNSRVDEAKAALDELLLRDTDQHPDVIAARKRLDALIAEAANTPAPGVAKGAPAAAGTHSRSLPNPIYEQIKVRLVDAEANIAAMQRDLAEQTRERNRLEEVLHTVPGLQAEFVNLNRDYDVLRRNYEGLLERRESMRIATAAEADADKIKIQIVDPPQVPQNPVAPKRIMLVTGVLAAGFGFGFALLLAQFDQSFHTLDELRDLGLPVAGSISLVAVTSRSAQMLSMVSFSVAIMALGGVYGGLVYHLLRGGGAV
jgi:polysaccharide chain length determinant protein (PEP-CTERM system associated)